MLIKVGEFCQLMNREAPTPRTATIRPIPPHPHFSLITLVEWIVIYKNIILKDSKSADQPVRKPSDPLILIVRAQLFSLQNQTARQDFKMHFKEFVLRWLPIRVTGWWVGAIPGEWPSTSGAPPWYRSDYIVIIRAPPPTVARAM